MCECGCSSRGPDFRFAGPQGLTYGLEIYPGCKDCEAPIAVAITRYTREDFEMFGLKHVPLLKFKNNDSAHPILHPRLLEKMIAKWIEEVGYDDATGAEVVAEEMIRDDLDDVLERSRKGES
jgi:hypothetical protein